MRRRDTEMSKAAKLISEQTGSLNEGKSFKSSMDEAETHRAQMLQSLRMIEGLLSYRIYGQGSTDMDGNPSLSPADARVAQRAHKAVQEAIEAGANLPGIKELDKLVRALDYMKFA